MERRDLYGLPLDRFVPERTALAKRLRQEGHGTEAAEVGSLRKPSVAAWAVNQLVRTQPRAVAELYEAGDALQQSQSQLLSRKGNAQALRDSLARERRAVGELVEKARGLLSSEGHELTPVMLERVSETLHAAALDAAARAQVRDGCLHRELRHVGLGSGAEVPVSAKRRRGGAPKAGPRATTGKASKRPAADARVEAEHAERLRAARRAEANARRVGERAARRLRSAEEQRDKLAASLQAAQEALADAQRDARDAELEHRRALKDLERLRQR